MITHLATCHNGQGYVTEGVYSHINLTSWEKIAKKALRETQTLRAGCSKAEPKIFTPPQTPSQGCRTANI